MEHFLMLVAGFLLCAVSAAQSQPQVLDSGWHHLRNTGTREWVTFAEKPDADRLVLHFQAAPNAAEYTLALRQADVRQNWNVSLNGQSIGLLVADEKDLIHYLRIAPERLAPDNTLEIASTDETGDDIYVGEILLYDLSPEQLLSQAHVSLEVVDRQRGERIPSRITIVNQRGMLQTTRASNDAPLAARPGYVYTANGKAVIGVPEGTYTVYATRGTEYGVDSARITLEKGDHAVHRLYIRPEVNSAGWIACDPHVHTFTWSGHGDASATERAITLAGEGIELPVITDHNINADITPFVRDLHLQRYFTPVTGNEVTTAVGHFNVFPVSPDEPVIPADARDWTTLREQLPSPETHAIILNHGRDIHRGFRPFDTTRHISPAGMRRDQQRLPANAMEIINSGAQQTDPFQLLHDWFGLLNHGLDITPVGASDAHDVSRYMVGQARTYIRGDDENPGDIDTELALGNFLAGNVLVSFGLLAELEINDTYGPGELVPGGDAVNITVRVQGPAWAVADKVTLYANGHKMREETIDPAPGGGVQWSTEWNMAMPSHDVFLVAVAEGPGRALPYWPIAKPYQPASPAWQPRLAGISGAVWLDADRNGKRNSARAYAESVLRHTAQDYATMMQELARYHPSVAMQTAALLHSRGVDLRSTALTRALDRATPGTRDAFRQMADAVANDRN